MPEKWTRSGGRFELRHQDDIDPPKEVVELSNRLNNLLSWGFSRGITVFVQHRETIETSTPVNGGNVSFRISNEPFDGPGRTG